MFSSNKQFCALSVVYEKMLKTPPEMALFLRKTELVTMIVESPVPLIGSPSRLSSSSKREFSMWISPKIRSKKLCPLNPFTVESVTLINEPDANDTANDSWHFPPQTLMKVLL